MSMLWFEALARYEYALRIDEDVCIQRFESNPFRTIRERGLVYGYGLQVPRSHRPTHEPFVFALIWCDDHLTSQTDERHEETLQTLPEWLSAYVESEKLPLPMEPAMHIFFTNVFISRVDWWFGDQVTAWNRRWMGAGFKTALPCRSLAIEHPSPRLPRRPRANRCNASCMQSTRAGASTLTVGAMHQFRRSHFSSSLPFLR
eukprot:2336033-Prymnesium_polylepis.2